jgi:hypothetical protein
MFRRNFGSNCLAVHTAVSSKSRILNTAVRSTDGAFVSNMYKPETGPPTVKLVVVAVLTSSAYSQQVLRLFTFT